MRALPASSAKGIVQVRKTDILRRQHVEIMRLATSIADRGKLFAGLEDAYAISLDLAKLLGQLRIHLAQEDIHLYRAMIRSGDPAAIATAQRFATEMGGLAQLFEDFATRWSSSAVIAACFADFTRESRSIFSLLETRVRRENVELYPLADALPAEGQSWAA